MMKHSPRPRLRKELWLFISPLCIAGLILALPIGQAIFHQWFPLTLRGHVGSIIYMAFSPDGKELASASMEWNPGSTSPTGKPIGDLKVWDTRSGALLWQIAARPDTLYPLFSPDGRTLVIWKQGKSNSYELWDALTGKFLRPLSNNDNGYPRFSKHGRSVFLVGSTVHERDILSGQLLKSVNCQTDFYPASAISPDETLLSCQSMAGKVQLWSLLTGARLRTLPGHATFETRFSPDGQFLAVGEIGHDPTGRLWDLQKNKSVLALPHVNRVRFSPDSKTLVAMEEYFSKAHGGIAIAGPVSFYDTQTGKLQWQLTWQNNDARNLAFSPDSHVVAIPCLLLIKNSHECHVQLFDTNTGRLLKTVAGEDSCVLRFSPDGKLLATAVGTDIKLWNVSRVHP